MKISQRKIERRIYLGHELDNVQFFLLVPDVEYEQVL